MALPRLAVLILLAGLAAPPALAGSQSSNSSSNCSGGWCSRVDSHVEEDRRYRRGWTRTEEREERPPPRWHRPAPWWPEAWIAPPSRRAWDHGRRWRRDDDD